MKYKVIFNLSGGAGDRGITSATFFKLQDAINAATEWSEIAGADAWYWNGSGWTAV